MHRIARLIVSVLLCLAAPAVGRAETPPPSDRTVVVAVQADYPPTCFRDPKTGLPQGFAIDVMNEVARRAGLRIRYVMGRTWKESQDMVLDGRADLIPALTIDEARKGRFAFTSPIDTLPISYIVRSDGSYNGPREGMRVGAMRGSAAESYLRSRTDIRLVPYNSLRRLLSDLLMGDLDLVLAPAPSIVKVALDLGLENHLRILEPPAFESIRAMALRPADGELLMSLNPVIDQFVGTPEYRKIYFKWWGKPKPFWTTAGVAWVVGAALTICAFAMGYWRYASLLRLNRTLGQTLEQLERSREELLRSEEHSRLLAQTAERERARNRAILEGIQDGISIQDREFRVLYQNSRFIEMTGAHPDEYCYLAYQQRDTPCDGCPVESTFRDGTPHSAVMSLNSQGGPLFIEILSAPLRDEEGKIIAVIESVRDITARKRMEEDLHEQAALLEQEVAERRRAEESLAVKQRQLEELNEVLARGINEAVAELRHKDQMLIQQGRLAAMGEMINNIAHQWRQPLNNIGLIVQNLQLASASGELGAEDLHRETTNAMDVILHMSHTIDDFRNFFRQDKEKRDFCINDVVGRCLEFIAASLENCSIRVEVTNEERVSATGYQNEYSQVLLNILNNARDALVERRIALPHISIRIGSVNGRSLVTIGDNGGGIAEDILPRIFDPYFTTKEPGKGTGIGLYMSKVIIEQHMEGRLSARNANGGAEFRIEV
ncbi:MAG TPA: transporter substrate-binding domain-containing protein [Desulfuromonadaceae bacterium]